MSAALLLASPSLLAQRPPARKAPPAAASGVAAQPKHKGIWEPINYKGDLELLDVHFATADKGWVAGGASTMQGAVILHTRDGGESWTVQLGDPESSERAFMDLRFVGETHGWATQSTGGARKLLRTTDGESWEVIGTIGSHYGDYAFTSSSNGIYVEGAKIFQTTDGGKSWRETFHCRTKAEVAGLTRDVECSLHALHFVSPTVGYAVGSSYQIGEAVFVVKTEDGGASWSVSHFPAKRSADEVYFIDASTGFARLPGGELYATRDGGHSWQGIAGAAGEEIKFADHQVGWSFLRHSRTLSYTTDGGKRWTTRDIAFPAMVAAFSLPRRDRGYVIGSHGMIYRYRVVPVTQGSPKALAGPLMPPRQP